MHKRPHIYEAASVVCAFAGIFLIATHGSLNSLAISRPALIWGLTSAVCFTIYCLYPQKLYNEYGLVNIIGWSSLIASIFLALVTKTFSLPHMDGRIIAASLAVAIVGSLIPFTIYGLGISILGSVKASLFFCHSRARVKCPADVDLSGNPVHQHGSDRFSPDSWIHTGCCHNDISQ